MEKNAFHSAWQYTVSTPVTCEGIGLHSGESVELTIYPAEEDAGITFVRGDLAEFSEIPADANLVTETRLGTTLTSEEGVSISTVEHLMAALWGLGVDNARIVVDGPEVPIMDGSSAPFIALIEEVGLKKQHAPREVMQVQKAITVEIGDSVLTIEPAKGFLLDIVVDYDHATISRQAASYDFSRCGFADTLSKARTFGFAHEVEMLQQMGLARGGSLDNAVVLGEDSVLNPEGLRFDDEFVRHKALDCVGDLFLSGYRLQGKITAYKPGHQINTALAQALKAQPEAWKLVRKAKLKRGERLVPVAAPVAASAEQYAYL